MGLFDKEVQKQLSDILSEMEDEVKIIFFTQQIECPMCRETGEFVKEITSLSDKLSFETYNFVNDKEEVKKYGVDKIPAMVLLDKDGTDHGVKYYGLPGGYEINSFLGTIIELSGKGEELPPDLLSEIKSIDKDIDIKVFVSLGCPHCPAAVSTGHRLAIENSRIKAEMIEANTFTHLSQKYNVTGVPKVVINEEHELTGAHPVSSFLEVIKKV